jgi:hypothetical protein
VYVGQICGKLRHEGKGEMDGLVAATKEEQTKEKRQVVGHLSLTRQLVATI